MPRLALHSLEVNLEGPPEPVLPWGKPAKEASERVYPALPSSVGNEAERVMRYWARVSSTLRTATRRSRLFTNAIVINVFSLSSAKKFRQVISVTAVPA